MRKIGRNPSADSSGRRLLHQLKSCSIGPSGGCPLKDCGDLAIEHHGRTHQGHCKAQSTESEKEQRRKRISWSPGGRRGQTDPSSHQSRSQVAPKEGYNGPTKKRNQDFRPTLGHVESSRQNPSLAVSRNRHGGRDRRLRKSGRAK